MLVPILSINDEVQINDRFIEHYKPSKKLIKTIYLVIDINHNIVYLDKNIYEHSNEINIIYLKLANQDNIKKIKKKEIIEIKEQEIKEDTSKKINIDKIEKKLYPINQEFISVINNDFFEVDIKDTIKIYEEKIQKLKTFATEKELILKQFKEIILTLKL